MATIEKKIGDKLISGLKKSATELEDFQVQLALGKAEAKDKYEELKKKFNSSIQRLKGKLGTAERKSVRNLVNDMEELQVQLALGKAETRDLFNEQKKKVFRAFNKLDKNLQVFPLLTETDEKLRHEMEMFRIKMELLDLHYALGAMDVKDKYEEKKKEIEQAIAKAKAKYAARRAEARKKSNVRHEELKEAYRHLKKAFI
jgi:hypothetical protein